MKYSIFALILVIVPFLVFAALPELEQGAYYAPNKFVVNFNIDDSAFDDNLIFNPSSTGIVQLDNLNQEYAVNKIEKLFPGSIAHQDEVELSGYYVFHFNNADETKLERVIEAYKSLSSVISVEPVGIHPVYFTPNDQFFNLQWHHNQTNDHDIDSPEAWEIEKGNPNAILGIADTGVLWTHSDLTANIWTNPGEIENNGIDDDGNGKIDDYRGWDWVNVGSGYPGEDLTEPDNDPKDFNGHGTHCAGIVAAVTDNNAGVAGIAGGDSPSQGAQVMALRIGWSGNYLGQEVGYVDMSYAASAFYYAAQKGVTAINCSWGSSNSGGLGAAVDYAVSHGMVVVTAAGNSNNQTPSYLGSRTDVIAIAATDDGDTKASFSSYGDWVDISAPGVNIASTYSDHYEEAYVYMSGTSMASPMVVGVAGLLKSQNPNWTSAEIVPQILNTADDISDFNHRRFIGKLGSGRLNAYNALNTGPPPPPVPSITVENPNGGETWIIGTTYSINWSSANLTDNVNILLNRDYPGGTWETLFPNAVDDGSESWAVTDGLSANCRIKVEAYSDPSIYDESDANFSIIEAGSVQPQVLFSDGFEGNFPAGFYTVADGNRDSGKDYWDEETIRPHTGSQSNYCAGKANPVAPPYDNNMEAHFELADALAIDLTGYSNAEFSFWMWYDTEPTNDYLNVQYYSGSGWIDFPGSPFSSPSGGGPVGWVQQTYSLDGISSFRFRFNFHSDASTTAEGVYIDDIEVVGTPGAGADGMVNSGTNLIISDYTSMNIKPNPFNPTTYINYQLSENADVKLSVYDISGRMVANLVDGFQSAGEHNITFDGSNLASGIYFAKLQSNGSTKVQKLLLIK